MRAVMLTEDAVCLPPLQSLRELQQTGGKPFDHSDMTHSTNIREAQETPGTAGKPSLYSAS